MDTWTFEFINAEAEEEFLALPMDIKARLDRIIELITEHGMERIGPPYVKHLRGKLWEFRAHGRTGQARSLYATVTGRRIIILRTFTKKTPKTPEREITLALARLKELQP